MAINTFGVVENALGQLYAQIACPAADREKWVADALRDLGGRYYSNRKIIDYSDTATQFGYIYRYVACHASILCQLLQRQPHVRQLFTNRSVSLACIGGGPGTDVLGVLKLRHALGSNAAIQATIYDKEPGWQRCWQIIEGANSQIAGTTVKYQEEEMGSPFCTGLSKDMQLITISYCVSELHAVQEFTSDTLDDLFSGAQPHAVFAIVDNGDSKAEERGRGIPCHEWMESFIERHGLEQLASSRHEELEVSLDEREVCRRMRSRYDFSYIASDGRPNNGYPKGQTRAAYWILRKR